MVRLSQEIGAIEIQITGIVQGVGFRPHVYKLATSLNLSGWVINTTAGVTIHLEGNTELLSQFTDELKNNPPPLARIDTFETRDVANEGYSSFFIHESKAADETKIAIPPDVGTCPDCLREYLDPKDRRYGYDFTNCVNCGPRFSITKAAPYDRVNTSMHAFKLCKRCAKEYTDPLDRRFHAEPNACPECGPHIIITDRNGKKLKSDITSLLLDGKILAVKGIGGYHLACNALDERTVKTLRERKKRQTKPFAIMCRDLDTVRKHCMLSASEEGILTSPARPIVLLKRKHTSNLPDEIAPGLDTLGVMLPYTPLHYGMFKNGLTVLVMTSANISGDPLITTEEDAYKELRDLADAFIIHHRAIVNRSDDSVITVFNGKEYFIRRSRGYVPRAIKVTRKLEPVFAAGGDLKSVFAFAKEDDVILSQYFGDLDNLKNFEAYRGGVNFFQEFLKITPKKVVADLHPDYVSTNFAESIGNTVIKVQHHKAHFASCMADNNINEKVLGVVCDGTGFGEEGNIWGCEFFYGDYKNILRVGSLQDFNQPRGDAVQKNPLQMGAVLLYQLLKDEEQVVKVLPQSEDILSFIKAQAFNKKLSIPSSSSGRIFDAAAAICGLVTEITYEGEAAMRMEALANNVSLQKPYPVKIIMQDGIYRISLDFLTEMSLDKLAGGSPEILAARFHVTFGYAIYKMLEILKKDYHAEKVVFSGGTFQNQLLINYLYERIPALGLKPYFHRQVPTNDGGIALGQIMLATGGE